MISFFFFFFGINLNSIESQSMGIMDKSYILLGINTDLRIDPNSIPYPDTQFKCSQQDWENDIRFPVMKTSRNILFAEK